MARISIITTVLNAERTIRDCIESVIRQQVPVEHIVIDGCSTDGTLGIIEKYGPCLSKIVSEKDNSLYEGMNKGIALAATEIIGILNADDVYAHPDVLNTVIGIFDDTGVDSCYGDLVYVDQVDTEKVRRLWRAGPYDSRRFYQGWMPPHPTFFVRKSVYERYGMFDIALGSSADYELMLRFLLKNGISTVYIPQILVKMRQGGKSNFSLKQRIIANRNDRQAWRVNDLKPYPWTSILKPLSKIGQFIFHGY